MEWMIDFLTWKKYGVPNDWMDRFFLWELELEDWLYQFVLVVEEWWLNVYSYRYAYGYEGFSDNWERCEDYFYEFSGWLDVNTLGYVEVEFDNIEDAQYKLYKSCSIFNVSIFSFNTDLRTFLDKHKKEIFPTIKIYNYYK